MTKLWLPIVAVAFVLVSIATNKLPFPYDEHSSELIPERILPLLLGGSEGPLPFDHHDSKANSDEWLSKVRKLFVGKVEGVESVGVARNGDLVLLDKYGYVHVARPSSSKHPKNDIDLGYELLDDKKLYIGPGRPLGFHVLEEDRNGNNVGGGGNEEEEELVVLVCCSLKGLLRVDVHRRTIEILANTASDGSAIQYANDLDIGPSSGVVYFTSSTEDTVGYSSSGKFYDTLRASILNFFRGNPSGRLFSYDPQTRRVRLLLDGLFYANGVAIASDESYVLVVETFGYRVLKLWLTGPRQGTTETMIGRLPGTPDGLSRSKMIGSSGGDNDDTFWICLVAKASPLAYLAPYPKLRQIAAGVIVPLLPKIASKILGSTAALRVDRDGKVLKTYLDPTSATVQSISGVTEHDGNVFFGSLTGNYVSVLNVKEDR